MTRDEILHAGHHTLAGPLCTLLGLINVQEAEHGETEYTRMMRERAILTREAIIDFIEQLTMEKMNISARGLDAIRHDEALRLTAYLCPAKVMTIGYGTTRIEGKPVPAGLTITKEKAEQLLAHDSAQFVAAVNRLVTVRLNQNQFDALVSFAYNAGVGALQQSTLLSIINQSPNDTRPVDIAKTSDKPALRDYLLGKGIKSAGIIEYNFYKWVWAGGKISNGLFNRRRREAALYFSPIA